MTHSLFILNTPLTCLTSKHLLFIYLYLYIRQRARRYLSLPDLSNFCFSKLLFDKRIAFCLVSALYSFV
jgi:hypothetical protein